LHQEITQPLSMILAQRKKKQQQAKQLHEEQPERKSHPCHPEYCPFIC